jgi:hypothetical protein
MKTSVRYRLGWLMTGVATRSPRYPRSPLIRPGRANSIERGIPLVVLSFLLAAPPASAADAPWFENPPESWPRIALVNQITYTDKHHPIAGCSFLVSVKGDTLAATAKHILKYFRSEPMDAVAFEGTLERWQAFPKDHPEDVVVFDRLVNEDPHESIEAIPAKRDWLLFTVEERSPRIHVLELRESPLVVGERVYIVGWRYSDRDCPQVIYEGNYVESDGGTVLISTDVLADNTMPGLSGAPVIDATGRVIGLMSQKAGKMERLASVEYPLEVLRTRSQTDDSP